MVLTYAKIMAQCISAYVYCITNTLNCFETLLTFMYTYFKSLYDAKVVHPSESVRYIFRNN